MDFVELAAAFGAEIVWTEGGRTREPLRFAIRGEGRADIAVHPELQEGECVAAIFAVARPGAEELARICLRREGALERGAKAVGLNREVQLGDPDFDAAVYVESEAPDAAIRQALADPAARSAARALLAAGLTEEVQLGEGRVSARIAGERLQDPSSPALREALDQLAALAAALSVPKDTPTRAELARRRPVGHIAAIALAWLVLLLLAVLLRPPPTLAWGPVWSALGLGALLWALCCAGLALVLRGAADSLRWLLISAAFFALVAPFAGMKLALHANAALDDGPAHTRTLPAALLDRSETRALVELSELGPEHPTARLAVPMDMFRGTLPPRLVRLRVTTRPGALGWEWVAELAP